MSIYGVLFFKFIQDQAESGSGQPNQAVGIHCGGLGLEAFRGAFQLKSFSNTLIGDG